MQLPPPTADELRTLLAGHPVSAAAVARYMDGWQQRTRWGGQSFPISPRPQPFYNPVSGGWQGPNFQPTTPFFNIWTGGGPQFGMMTVTPPPASYLVGVNGIHVDDNVIEGYLAGDGVEIDDNVISAAGVPTKFMLLTEMPSLVGDYRWEYVGVEADPTTAEAIEGGEEFTVINMAELMNTSLVIGHGVKVEPLLARGFTPLPIGVTVDLVLQSNCVVPLYRPPPDLRSPYEWVMNEPTNIDGECEGGGSSGILIQSTEPVAPVTGSVWWDTSA